MQKGLFIGLPILVLGAVLLVPQLALAADTGSAGYYLEIITIPVVAVVLAILIIGFIWKWKRASKDVVTGGGGLSTNQLATLFILVMLEAAALGYIVYLASVGWRTEYWGQAFASGNWLYHIILPVISIVLLVIAIVLPLHWRKRGKFVIMSGQTFGWRWPVVMILLGAAVFLFTFTFSTVGIFDWVEEIQTLDVATDAKAQSDISIIPNSTEHTVAYPYEKSFRFVATITNNSSETKTVIGSVGDSSLPAGWHILSPIGYYELTPGESVDWVAVIEPALGPAPEDGYQTGGAGEQAPSLNDQQAPSPGEGGPMPPGTEPPPPPNDSPEPPDPPRPESNPRQDDSRVPPPGGQPAEAMIEDQTVTLPLEFSWEGGSQNFDIVVSTTQVPFAEDADQYSEVTFEVEDSKGDSISGAAIIAYLPSGLESIWAETSGEDYVLRVPSAGYIEKIRNEYDIDLSTVGYHLQVAVPGYQNYFDTDWLPDQPTETKVVELAPLELVGDFEKYAELNTGFSTWWIRSSEDNKYFALSQGTHGSPEIEPPDKTLVTFTDSDGNQLWANETAGECWGLDVSPNGDFVAAGCLQGDIYVWDKAGAQKWVYDNEQGSQVRWVKFSNDGQSLLSGPVEGQPELAGLFDVESGDLKWTYFTGDYLREGRFSADNKTVYVDPANGFTCALDAESGNRKWCGSGEHIIPFLLGISEEKNMLMTTGKGRAFASLDLSDGSNNWITTVDQTVTAAGMSAGGTTVGGTVGGYAYQIDPEGKLDWVREYGGMGHNAVEVTADGSYSLFGGPNPTLLDNQGNVLWQREPNKQIEMIGVNEINTGAAYDVWLADDGSMFILGGDDGSIEFYKGKVKDGKNTYSQLTGPRTLEEADRKVFLAGPIAYIDEDGVWHTMTDNWWIWGIIALVIIGLVVLTLYLKRRHTKTGKQENKQLPPDPDQQEDN